MTQEQETPARGWRYGIHPKAAGARVRSLGRVEMPLGEALRLEMVGEGPESGVVHLQYYIDTDAGAWALWISCSVADVGEREEVLRDVALPFPDDG